MKIDKKKYLKKIDYIDKMLSNTDILDEYVLNIENSEFEVPSNIEEMVRLNINNKKKSNYKYLNILKVACFSLVVMITWTAMNNISINRKLNKNIAKEKNPIDNVEIENRIFVIYGKANDITNTFSSVLLSPTSFEGGEK